MSKGKTQVLVTLAFLGLLFSIPLRGDGADLTIGNSITVNGDMTVNGMISGTSGTWNQTLQCDTTACPRFQLAFGGGGVLDKETGLVWERSPSTSTVSTWETAQQYCIGLNLGNRRGWRLPTVQELASLWDGDPANTSSPRLPPGNPFLNVQGGNFTQYWSATTSANDSSYAWCVNFLFPGGMSPFSKAGGLSANSFVWCVRGGQGVDPQ